MAELKNARQTKFHLMLVQHFSYFLLSLKNKPDCKPREPLRYFVLLDSMRLATYLAITQFCYYCLTNFKFCFLYLSFIYRAQVNHPLKHKENRLPSRFQQRPLAYRFNSDGSYNLDNFNPLGMTQCVCFHALHVMSVHVCWFLRKVEFDSGHQ